MADPTIAPAVGPLNPRLVRNETVGLFKETPTLTVPVDRLDLPVDDLSGLIVYGYLDISEPSGSITPQFKLNNLDSAGVTGFYQAAGVLTGATFAETILTYFNTPGQAIHFKAEIPPRPRAGQRVVHVKSSVLAGNRCVELNGHFADAALTQVSVVISSAKIGIGSKMWCYRGPMS